LVVTAGLLGFLALVADFVVTALLGAGFAATDLAALVESALGGDAVFLLIVLLPVV